MGGNSRPTADPRGRTTTLRCGLELPPGSRGVDYHFHHGTEELLIVLRGMATLRTPEGERELPEGRRALLVRARGGAYGDESERSPDALRDDRGARVSRHHRVPRQGRVRRRREVAVAARRAVLRPPSDAGRMTRRPDATQRSWAPPSPPSAIASLDSRPDGGIGSRGSPGERDRRGRNGRIAKEGEKKRNSSICKCSVPNRLPTQRTTWVWPTNCSVRAILSGFRIGSTSSTTANGRSSSMGRGPNSLPLFKK